MVVVLRSADAHASCENNTNLFATLAATDMQEAVRKIVERFELVPHPEGGYFREIFRSDIALDHPGIDPAPGRAPLRQHADLLPARGPRLLRVSPRPLQRRDLASVRGRAARAAHDRLGAALREALLTGDLASGEPACVVPAGCWQAARLAPGSAWAFCGCTVAPGFDFADFEMPPGDELAASFPAHERIIRELTRR